LDIPAAGFPRLEKKGRLGFDTAGAAEERTMKRYLIALCTAVLLSAARGEEGGAVRSVRLEELDLGRIAQGWGKAAANRSVDGNPLRIGTQTFERGIGTHAPGAIRIALDGKAERFTAKVGVDAEVRERGSVSFRVIADRRLVYESGNLQGGDPAQPVDVPLAGVSNLLLIASAGEDGMDYDHADWADPVIRTAGADPVIVAAPPEAAVVLTPEPPVAPRINHPRIVGVRPGSPLLFTVPASGARPMKFSARGLPAGLALDPETGIIAGRIEDREKKTHRVAVAAENGEGRDERELRIVVGDRIALTPPMGWNSWNCFAHAVDDAKVRAAAEAMAMSGLMHHGWAYINIDDYWQVKPGDADPTLQGPARTDNGVILPNPRFPDMKALTRYIHGLGLKAGLYSSPGPLTCGGCVGSHEHETLDAMTYADWGFDYLKYDWCSYSRIARDSSLEELMKPYRLMGSLLREQSRDIVFSLCQYGMGNVASWGAEVDGNCWRTTGDITDTWESMSGIGFGQAGLERYAGPGRWNDPDMLVVGHVGWGPSLHPTRLTPNEQYTHISLWSLLCSPLLIGCDLTQLDAFTLGLLSNDEVIGVNQDPLGRQARRVAARGDAEVWAKEMEDGSRAVGLFNRGEIEGAVAVAWGDLGLEGPQRVRDLWRQKDLGVFEDRFAADVARHGAVLVRVWSAAAQ
jgi:alpha-galactosidase